MSCSGGREAIDISCPADRGTIHMTDVWRFYERFANTFDRERGKSLIERPYMDAVTSGLQPGAGVLDLGCGAGDPIARHFVEHGYNVTGVDAAPAMIALCRQRFPEATWIEADMRGLALARRFDAIIAWDSFFHLDQDEQRAMFPVFARHIAPGGKLLFTSGPRADIAMGSMYGEDVFHASLDPEEYEFLLEAAGFRMLRFQPEDPKCGGHTVWLAQQDG
jgi:SAM-dependent methyltransferase